MIDSGEKLYFACCSVAGPHEPPKLFPHQRALEVLSPVACLPNVMPHPNTIAKYEVKTIQRLAKGPKWHGENEDFQIVAAQNFISRRRPGHGEE